MVAVGGGAGEALAVVCPGEVVELQAVGHHTLAPLTARQGRGVVQEEVSRVPRHHWHRMRYGMFMLVFI